MGFLTPVFQFIGAIFVGAGAGASAGYVFAVNVARIGLLALSAKVFAPKPDFSQIAETKRLTIRDPIAPQAFVYGEDMLSGPITFSNVGGSENRDLFMCIALCGHEIDSVQGYRIDSTDIPLADLSGAEDGNVQNSNKYDGVASVTLRKGTSTQAVVSALSTEYPSLFTASHTGRGWAYMVWEFNLIEGSEDVFKTQPNNVRAIVRGKKVYDPRLDSTNGGSGLHRLADATTWEWSDNPALCLADYIRDDKFGMREEDDRVNWPLVATAADVCDELVSIPGATTQKRYTCNATFLSTETRSSVRDELLNAMLGRMVFSQGKWCMWAGEAQTATVTLTEANLAGGVQVQASSPSQERYNRVRGKYIDPSLNYSATTYPEQRSTTYETDDGGEVLELVADFTSCNNFYEAQRKAIITLKQSRNQRVVVFEGNWSCFRIQPGKVVSLTIAELGFSGEKFFVTEWRLNETGVTLTLLEEIDSAWSDPLVGDYSTRSATGTITFGDTGVPAPTSLTATGKLEGNLIAWTNPLANTFTHVEIWAADENVRSSAVKIGETPGTQFLEPIISVALRTRYYWVRAVNQFGQVSAWTPDLTTTTAVVSPLANRANLNTDPEFDFSNLEIDGTEANPHWRGSATAGTGSVELNVGAGAGGSNVVDFIKGTSNVLTLDSKHYSIWRKAKGTFLCAIKYKTIGSADSLDHLGYTFWVTTTDNADNPSSFNSFGTAAPTIPRNSTANWHTLEVVIDFEILQPSSIPDDYIRFGITQTGSVGTVDTLRIDSFVVIPLGTQFGTVAAASSAVAPGLVPTASAAESGLFLRGDGTWATPSASGTTVNPGTTAGAMLVWNTGTSEWDETTEVINQAGRLDIITSSGILRLHNTTPVAAERRTDIKMDSSGNFSILAIDGGGLNSNVLMSALRFNDTWEDVTFNSDTHFTFSANVIVQGSVTAEHTSPGLAVNETDGAVNEKEVVFANLSGIGSIHTVSDVNAFGEYIFQWTRTGTAVNQITIHGDDIVLDPDDEVRITSSVFLAEQAAAQADQAGWGQLWVRNDTPNTLMFTDDAGNDIVLDGQIAIPILLNDGEDIRFGSSQDVQISYDGTANALVIEDFSATATDVRMLGLQLLINIASNANSILIVGESSTTRGSGQNAIINMYGEDGSVIDLVQLQNTGAYFWLNAASVPIIMTGQSGQPMELNVASIKLAEVSAAPADEAAYGQFWVINSAPNMPRFTTDTGVDIDFVQNVYSGTTSMIAGQSNTATGNTSGATVRSHDGTLRDVGFNTLDIEVTNASVTLGAEHCGAVIYFNNATAYTVTMPASTALDFPVYGMVTLINHADTNRTISAGTNNLYWQDGTSTLKSGNRTLGPRAVANIWRHSSGAFFIWGTGIS